MKVNLYLILILFALNTYASIPKTKTLSPRTLELDFDFFVKTDSGPYEKEYTGNAVVENNEEVVFLYNNRIAKTARDNKNGIKISIKPFITNRNSNFLVKYYKKQNNEFYLISKSLVKINSKNDSKIQIIDGEKVYKLLINAKNQF